jgi:hypothetical protein
MRLNLEKSFVSRLSPEKCLKLLEEGINSVCSSEFKILPLVSEFRFYRSKTRTNCFYLHPRRWDFSIWIFGQVKRSENNSALHVKMYPPLWFFLLLFYIGLPYLIFGAGKFASSFPLLLFWLGLASIITGLDIYMAVKLLTKLEGIIKGFETESK